MLEKHRIRECAFGKGQGEWNAGEAQVEWLTNLCAFYLNTSRMDSVLDLLVIAQPLNALSSNRSVFAPGSCIAWIVLLRVAASKIDGIRLLNSLK